MRPEGFDAEKIAQKALGEPTYNEQPFVNIRLVEAGADAMLEGLKKTSIAEYGNVDYWDNDLNIKGALFSFGYLVFIPTEEE